jgi:hypothetical protein
MREVYRCVSGRFFPSAGKTPHEALFLHPQYNTWIELTYNQNQRDVLAYARAIGANGFPKGVLMIDEGWFSHYGNLLQGSLARSDWASILAVRPASAASASSSAPRESRTGPACTPTMAHAYR